jgi:hypothetical protein
MFYWQARRPIINTQNHIQLLPSIRNHVAINNIQSVSMTCENVGRFGPVWPSTLQAIPHVSFSGCKCKSERAISEGQVINSGHVQSAGHSRPPRDELSTEGKLVTRPAGPGFASCLQTHELNFESASWLSEKGPLITLRTALDSIWHGMTTVQFKSYLKCQMSCNI